MPRPKKIRKKKSFMFTSRHYSFIGTLSIVLAVCSLIGLFTAILLSSYNGGRNSGRYGGVGLFRKSQGERYIYLGAEACGGTQPARYYNMDTSDIMGDVVGKCTVKDMSYPQSGSTK